MFKIVILHHIVTMFVQSDIIVTLPLFHMDDAMEGVVDFFQNNTHSHIAIVEDGLLMGMLGEIDCENLEANQTVADYSYQMDSFFVKKDTSWFDLLEAFARNDANLVPVVDENGLFLGYYQLHDVVQSFIDTPFFIEPGGILVLEKQQKDYSFSEIAQIVESNNAKLIGGFISEMRDEMVQVTLKVSGSNLPEIIQTFRRYSYNIVFGDNNDLFYEDLKQRSDYLDKYLNV